MAQKQQERAVSPFGTSNYQMSPAALKLLEPIAKAWTGPVGSNKNYNNINDAWGAVCSYATKGAPNAQGGLITDDQARKFAELYPKENGYNLYQGRKPVVPKRIE